MYPFSETLCNTFTINKYDIFIMHIVYIVVLIAAIPFLLELELGLGLGLGIRVRIGVRN